MAEATLRDDQNASVEGNEISIEYAGVSFRFHTVDELLSFGSFAPTGQREDLSLDAGYEYCREQEIHITGVGRDFPARSRSLGGIGASLRFEGLRVEHSNGEPTFLLSYVHETLPLKVVSHYQFVCESIPVVRRWSQITNVGNASVGLEYASSVALYHLASGGVAHDGVTVHLPYSSWSGEGQWQACQLSQLGIRAADASHYRASCTGSRASAEMSPMAVIVNETERISYFFQIEHSASWMWEIGNLYVGNQHGLYLTAGGPSEDYGHWWKDLQPGETYSTVPVAIGCVKGGFTEAIHALTKYRRHFCRKPHSVDDTLPVIFNDYMNGIWGDPSYEKEVPLVDAAASAGAEVFCIDAGYYAAPGESWWPGVGEWKVHPDRFPDGSFSRLLDYIRSKNMIPGLWLEAESCGIQSPMANKPNDWFLSRHGKRIAYNKRYFWNFRNDGVIQHLSDTVKRFVEDYGIGYIKNDYNIDLHAGTDTQADSLGDGLMEQTRAFYDWIDSMRERYPSVIWENCAAGGLRADYGMLSRMQLQSSSDQEKYENYAAVSVGSSALVLPEQMAVWAYPKENDVEKTIYNMANTLLFRIHLAGRPDQLDDRNNALIKEAIDYYNSSRHRIKKSLPFYPLGIPAINDEACWLAMGMREPNGARLVVWRRNAVSDHCSIPLQQLPKIAEARCVYPKSPEYEPSFCLEDNSLRLSLPATCSARVFELTYQT